MSAVGAHLSGAADAPASDDALIESKPPHICVDYLSHEWKDEDMWNSWKAMTKRKNEIANGVRLENASWRTWAKQRGKLKTVSPDTLNWLKESDVTWLYGPLHGDAAPVPPPKVSSMADRLGIDEGRRQHKPILKYRTLSQVLTTPLAEAERLPPATHHEVPVTATQRVRDAPGLVSAMRGGAPPKGRHIRFNTAVEQCIAIDYDEPNCYGDYDDDEYGSSDSADDDDGDGDGDGDDGDDDDGECASEVLAIQDNPRTAGGRDAPHTIAKLAPTRLKCVDEPPVHPPVHPPGHPPGHSPGHPPYDTRELDAQYSLADETPLAHELRWDEDLEGRDVY